MRDECPESCLLGSAIRENCWGLLGAGGPRIVESKGEEP